MDEFLKLYHKGDHPTQGVYKVLLEEVADALGYFKGFDCNMKPYYRTLNALTNEYPVEKMKMNSLLSNISILRTSFRIRNINRL